MRPDLTRRLTRRLHLITLPGGITGPSFKLASTGFATKTRRKSEVIRKGMMPPLLADGLVGVLAFSSPIKEDPVTSPASTPLLVATVVLVVVLLAGAGLFSSWYDHTRR